MSPITDELIRQIASTINEDEIETEGVNMLHSPMSQEVRDLLDDEPRFLESVREIMAILSENK